MCVQGVDVQCVLQFTLIHAAGCALHRRTSRVIHRSKLFVFFAFVTKQRKLSTQANEFFGNNAKSLGRSVISEPGKSAAVKGIPAC